MTLQEMLEQGGDLIELLRDKTPKEGQQMLVAIYSEGAAAMAGAMEIQANMKGQAIGTA